MANLVDQVTARALRHSLDARFPAATAAAELVGMAEHRQWVIERALVRVRRAQAERASVVGERAQRALVAALAELAGGPSSWVSMPAVVRTP